MMKPNGSGTNFMNLSGAGDPLHKKQYNKDQPDYNYNVGQSNAGNNPILASVHTQGSLKNDAKTAQNTVTGSHGGSAIIIASKEGTKSNGASQNYR